MRPTHQLIGPYAALLDKMRAEANLLREWTQVLSSEIVGPVTPYMGSPVIPSPVVPSHAATHAPAAIVPTVPRTAHSALRTRGDRISEARVHRVIDG
jgi:hypothetical protein